MVLGVFHFGHASATIELRATTTLFLAEVLTGTRREESLIVVYQPPHLFARDILLTNVFGILNTTTHLLVVVRSREVVLRSGEGTPASEVDLLLSVID